MTQETRIDRCIENQRLALPVSYEAFRLLISLNAKSPKLIEQQQMLKRRNSKTKPGPMFENTPTPFLKWTEWGGSIEYPGAIEDYIGTAVCCV